MPSVALPQPVVIAGRYYSTYAYSAASPLVVPTVVANITGTTNTSPILVTIATLPNNGIANFPISAQLTIAGVLGNTNANGAWVAVPRQGVVTSVSNGFPMAITTAAPHGLTTGQSVAISDSTSPFANGTFPIVVTGASTFTLTGTGGGTAGTGGTWLLVGAYELVGSTGNGVYTSGGTVTLPVVVATLQKAALVADGTQ